MTRTHTGWEEEDKLEERRRLERKRLAASASVADAALKNKGTSNKTNASATTPKRARPKKTPKPLGDQQITRVSPLDNPAEIDECCGVCFDGDSYDDNPILFCEKCDVAVHQHCYGVKKIPEGDWFCKACAALKRDNRVVNPRPKQCCLCTVKGGALKRTSDGRWAHLFCGQWIPELFISDVDAMEPIENVHEIDKDRLSLTCVVCKTADGACVQCAYGVCPVPYHPMCALRQGVRMEVRSRDGCDDVEYLCYCDKHVKEMEKRERRAARAAAAQDGDPGPDTPGGAPPTPTPAADDQEQTPKPTPPPTPKQDVVDVDVKREEDTPSTTTTTTKDNGGLSHSKPSTTTTTTTMTTSKVVLNELTSRESQRLVANVLELESASSVDAAATDAGVTREDFDAWLAKDADDIDADDAVDRAVREWLARKTRAELFAPVHERLGDVATAFAPAITVLVDHRDDDDDDDDDDARTTTKTSTDVGLPEPVPYPVEHLAAYTKVSLETARAPLMPETVEDVLPDPTGAQQPILRLAKCEVCEIHRRGICGTSSAVMRCHRRRENLERARAACMAELAKDPDPEARIRRELERVEGAVDVMKLAPDDEVVAEIFRAQTVLARQSYVNKTLIARLLEKVERALPEEARARRSRSRAGGYVCVRRALARRSMAHGTAA